jgi:hypothetical protein
MGTDKTEFISYPCNPWFFAFLRSLRDFAVKQTYSRHDFSLYLNAE